MDDGEGKEGRRWLGELFIEYSLSRRTLFCSLVSFVTLAAGSGSQFLALEKMARGALD